jgi:hypothetical protein
VLDFGQAPLFLRGLTVFRDHADPARFYALLEGPRVRRDEDGAPRLALALLRAGPDRPGSGLFSLEAELGWEEAEREALLQELGALAGGPVVVTEPPWISGSAALLGFLGTETPGAAGFVTERLGAARPSLVGAPRVVLGAALTEAGAALLRGALRGDGLPAGVLFDLEAHALMGPLGVDVEVDLRMVHERFAVGGYLATPYGKAEIRAIWEELVENKVVRERVIDASGDSDGARAEALRRASEEVTRRLFEATLTPVPLSEGRAATSAYVRLGFRLKLERDSLEGTAVYRYRERRAARFHHYPQASLVELLGGRGPETVIREVDGGSDFFQTTEVRVSTQDDLTAEGLDALTARLTWSAQGDAPELVREVVLWDEAREATLTVPRAPNVPFRVEAKATYGGDQGGERVAAPRSAVGRYLLLDLAELFPTRALTLVPGRLDFSWLAEVTVTLRGPAQAQTATLLSAALPLTFRLEGEGPRTVDAVFVGREGEPSWRVEGLVADEDVLVLDGPFAPDLALLVAVVASDDLDAVTVELVREEASGFRHARSLSLTGPDWEPVRTTLRRLDAGESAYRRRVTRSFLDGRVEIGDWQTTTDTVLLVAERGLEPRRVGVTLLAGGPDKTGDALVEARVVAEAPEGTELGRAGKHVFRGAESEAEVVIAVPVGFAGSLRLELRRFSAGGGVVASRMVGEGPFVVV